MSTPMTPQEARAGRIAEMPPPDPIALAADLGRSLQLSRANALALTRLQLAIKSNDRQAAMAALDRLHSLDREMERLVEHLPPPEARASDRAEWEAIVRHLSDQKLALAFEKLAVASEISGPDLVTARQPQHFHPPVRAEEWPGSQAPSEAAAEPGDPPPLADWPQLRAAQSGAVSPWVWVGLAAVTVMLALATAAVAMTWGWI